MYAIGEKLKLILCGFHEASLMAQSEEVPFVIDELGNNKRIRNGIKI